VALFQKSSKHTFWLFFIFFKKQKNKIKNWIKTIRFWHYCYKPFIWHIFSVTCLETHNLLSSYLFLIFFFLDFFSLWNCNPLCLDKWVFGSYHSVFIIKFSKHGVSQKFLCLAWFSTLISITQNSKFWVRVMETETANRCFQKLRTKLWVMKTEI